jgi:hypothetical protein
VLVNHFTTLEIALINFLLLVVSAIIIEEVVSCLLLFSVLL